MNRQAEKRVWGWRKKWYVSLFLLMVFIGLPLNVHIEQGGVRIGMNEAYAADETWLSGWGYRRAVVINNASGGTLSDYQVKIELNSTFGYSKCQSAGEDLRFIKSGVDQTEANDLDYWIETWDTSGTSTIWVEYSSTLAENNSTIYLYYGNSGASAANNGTNTFEFFDDFEDGNYTSNPTWTVDHGSFEVQSSIKRYGNYAVHALEPASYLTFDHGITIYDHIVEFWIRTPVTNSYSYVRYSINNEKATDLYLTQVGDFKYYDTAWRSFGCSYSADTWYRIKYVCGSTTTYDIYIYNKDGTLKCSKIGANLRVWAIGTTIRLIADNALLYVDNIFFRKYASSEPATTVYAEQENLIFSYRKAVTITNSGSEQTYYQVDLTAHYGAGTDSGKNIYLNSHCKTDFSDIRFGDANGHTFAHWRESYTASDNAVFWVKIPTIPAGTSTTTLYIYYGNDAAASASNGEAAFEFFDDGETYSDGDSLTIGGWTLTGGTGTNIYEYDNSKAYQGSISLYGNSFGGGAPVYSTYQNFANPATDGSGILEFDMYDNGGNNYGSMYFSDQSNTEWIVFGYYTGHSATYYIIEYGSGYVSLLSTVTRSVGWHHFRMDVKADGSAEFWIDGDKSTTTAPAGELDTAGRVHLRDYSNTLTWWDRIRVRKYAADEPAVAMSGSESEEAYTTNFTAHPNDWAYRVPVTITNSGSAQTNYQVSVTVDTATPIAAGHMNSDCSDIRFSSTNDFDEEDWAVSYPYWIESGKNSASTVIWVKVDDIAGTPTDTTIYMYYGNPGAGSGSSGTNTFEFFDDFEGTSLDTASKWNTPGDPTIAVSDGEVTVTSVDADAAEGIETKSTWQAGYAVRSKSMVAVSGVFAYLLDYCTVNFTSPQSLIGYWNTGPKAYASYNESYESLATSNDFDSYQIHEIRRLSGSFAFYFNDVLQVTHSNNIAGGTDNLVVGAAMVYDASTQVKSDWILVRKYAADEPSASAGSEQLPNLAPTGIFTTAALPSQKTDGTGYVDVSIDVADVDEDDCKAKIEWSDAEGGLYQSATLVGPATATYSDSGDVPDINNLTEYQAGSGTNTRIITSSGSNTVTFDWDSKTDVPAGDNTYYLKLTVNDDALDQEIPVTQSVPIDNVAPSNPTLALTDSTSASGTYTNSQTVNATVGNDAGAASWLISETDSTQPAEGAGGWSTEPAVYTFDTAVNELKTVYIWLKDAAGNINTGPISGTITLDTSVPSDPTLTLTDTTSASGTYTNSQTVNAAVGNDAGAASWLISETDSTQPAEGAGGWSTEPATYTFDTAVNELKTVYIWLKDAAGNINTGPISGTITLDTSVPSDPTLTLTDTTSASGTYTNSQTVNAAVGNDAGAASWLISETDSTQPAEGAGGWSTEPAVYTFDTAVNELKTVYIWLKDAAGNINTGPISGTITLDTSAPDAFTTGAVIATGVPVTAGYWNEDNTGLDVTVPIANDSSLTGGSVQIEAKIGANPYTGIGSAGTILVGELDGTHTVSLTAVQFEAITGFADTAVVTINAKITDAAGNETEGTASATTITVDQTAPTISSATLNYGTGVLVISCSEIIDALPASNVDLTKIHINDVTNIDNITLKDGGYGDATVTTSQTETTVTIQLTEEQRRAALAKSGYECGGNGGAVVLDVDAGALMDLAGNTNPIDDNNTVTETPDAVKPTISSVILDYSDGTLTVVFSETVRNTLTYPVVTSGFHINNISGVNDITLSQNSASPTGTEIVFSLTEKERTDALVMSGVAGGDTAAVYLDIDANSVIDERDNYNIALSEQVTETPDTTKPSLSANKIDVNNSVQPNIIIIQACEALDETTAAAAGNWVIKDNAEAITYNIVSASLSKSIEENVYDTVTLTLSAVNPAGSATYITNAQIDAGIKAVFSSSAITDLAGNTFADATVTESGGIHTKDSAAPTLPAGSIDVNNSVQPNTVTLEFSEKLDKASAESTGNWAVTNSGGAITYGIASASLADNIVTLTLNTVNPAVSTTFITNADIDSHIIVTPATGITDVAGIAYAAGEITELGGTHTKDSAAPTLPAGSIDVNNSVQPNTVTLEFSEKLDKASAENTGNWAVTNSGGAITYGIASASLADNIVTLTLNTVNPAVSTTFITNADIDSHIIVTPATGITDVAGIAYAAGAQAELGGTHTKDSAAPTLPAGDIAVDNINQPNRITLQFSEKLDKASAESTGNWAVTNSGAGITYTINSVSLSNNTVTMTLADVNPAVNTTFITNADIDSHIIVTPATGITDVAGIAYAAGAISEAGSALHSKDEAAPTAVNWTLNMGTGAITINFSEIMDTSQNADVTTLTLQENNNTDLSAEIRTLTGSASETWESVSPWDTWTMTLSAADTVAIQGDTGLCVSKESSFLEIAAGSNIKDIAGNNLSLTNVTDGACLGADTFTADGTFPNLIPTTVSEGWVLNLDNQTMQLTFDEPVDVENTLDVSGITIQSEAVYAAETTHSYTLTTSSSPSSNGETITIDISPDDISAIYLDTGLAINKATSWISLTSSTIKDGAGNPVVAVPESSAIQAFAYVSDSTTPTILSAALDYTDHSSTLTVTCSEIIDASETTRNYFYIRKATGVTADQVQLNADQVFDETDGKTLTFTLTEAQRAAAVAISGLDPGGDDTDAVVLDVAANAVYDMIGNPNSNDLNNTVTETADETVPTAEITSYSPDHAVKSGNTLRITATFNEDMALSPAPKIVLSGANTLTATAMTRTDATHYYYDHTVGAGNGTATVSLSAGTDLCGNLITPEPTSGATFTVDNTAPTAAITYSGAGGPYKQADAVTVTATFTESDSISGTPQIAIDYEGVVNDVSATNMTATGNNKVWTYSMTVPSGDNPAADPAVITITGQDIAGNSVGAHSGNTFIVDNTVPTAAITYPSDADGRVKQGDTLTIRATFNEDMADSPIPQIAISYTGGISSLPAVNMTKESATSYTYDLDVPAGDGVGTVSLSAGTDTAGNVITAAPTSGANFTVDNTAPTTAVTVSVDPIKIGALTQTVTVTYSETMDNSSSPVITFTGTRWGAQTGGAWSTVTLTDDTYTATFTHDGTSEEIAAETASVANASGAMDLVGNAEAGDDSPAFVVDTRAPTAAITYSPDRRVKDSDTLTITATFNENMADSPIPQIAISYTGGISSLPAVNMTKASATSYTYALNVPAGDGVGTVSLSAGTDTAGNVITAAPTSGANFTVDNTVPTVVDDWALNLSAGTIIINFNETMDSSQDVDETKITLQENNNTDIAIELRTLTDSTSAWTDGDTLTITLSSADASAIWADTGLGVSAATSFLEIIPGSNIKDSAGNNLNLTNVTDGACLAVTIFTPKGTLTITAPASGTSWAVSETTRAITWTPAGNLDNVTLWYATENDSYAAWTQIDSSGSITASSGTHTWSVVPDILAAVGQNPQTDNTIAVKIKVVDADDTTISSMSNAFNVIYYAITWRVLDTDSLANLSDVTVSCSSGWSESSLSSAAGITRYYTYGTYTTTFSKDQYNDGSQSDWMADSDKTLTVYLESTLSAQIVWDAVSGFNYDGANTVTISSWIEKRGILKAGSTSAEIRIYDSDEEISVSPLNNSSADAQGVFWTTWDVTDLAKKIYFVKTAIVYQSSTYTSGITYDFEAVKEEAEEISSQTAFRSATESTLSTVRTAVTSTIPTKVDAVKTETAAILEDTATTLPAKIDTVKTDTESIIGYIDTEVGAILEDTGTTVPALIEAELDKGVQAQILNRTTTLTTGKTAAIRYRTAAGLSPTISVYDADNNLVVDGTAMTEINDTGIYEYDLTAQKSWGSGDFTVLCQELTQSSIDSMILTVKAVYVAGEGVEESLDQIGEIVATVYTRAETIEDILGTTSDTSVSNTMFGSMAAVSDTVDKLAKTFGATLSADARSAKTNALNAYNELQAIKKDVNSLSSQFNALDKTLTYLEELKRNLLGISGEIASKTALAGTAAPEVTVTLSEKGVTAVGGESEVGEPKSSEEEISEETKEKTTKEELKTLNNKIDELGALIRVVTKLMDHTYNKPIIEGWFEEE